MGFLCSMSGLSLGHRLEKNYIFPWKWKERMSQIFADTVYRTCVLTEVLTRSREFKPNRVWGRGVPDLQAWILWALGTSGTLRCCQPEAERRHRESSNSQKTNAEIREGCSTGCTDFYKHCSQPKQFHPNWLQYWNVEIIIIKTSLSEVFKPCI